MIFPRCVYQMKLNTWGFILIRSPLAEKIRNYRVSQAVSASKLLRPLLSHSSLPPSWKLTVYRSIILSILTYAKDSARLSPSQIQKMNTIPFKSLRRIFKIKSSFYHRVLEPTTADCFNEYLAGLAYDTKRIPTPSQLYSQQRLQLLGHLYCHMDTLEYQVTFMGSHSYRHVLSPNRPGRPRPHWAESCLTEASRRIFFLQSDDPPKHSDIHTDFFAIPTLQQIYAAHGSSTLLRMDNTPLYRKIHLYSQNRANWRRLLHKPNLKGMLNYNPLKVDCLRAVGADGRQTDCALRVRKKQELSSTGSCRMLSRMIFYGRDVSLQ